MPRIPYAEEGTEAKEATPVYANLKASFGFVPNLLKVLGHSGPATQALGGLLVNYFHHLSLTARLREIAYLTVARSNECAYCIGHHTLIARQAEVSDEEIALLGESGFTNEKFSAAERVVIRFAYETTKYVVASDNTLDELQKHYNPTQIAEIAFVVATANFIQRIGKNFGIELEQQ